MPTVSGLSALKPSTLTSNFKQPPVKKCRKCKREMSGAMKFLKTALQLPTRICQKCRNKQLSLKAQIRSGKLSNSVLRKQKIQERKERKKLRKLQSKKGRRSLKKKAEKLLHKLVRMEAIDPTTGLIQCYTCLKWLPPKKIHAGHFWHGKLDLDRRNLRPQCGFNCNISLSGNLARYSSRLIRENGLAWFQQLEQDAHNEALNNYSYDFLQAKIQELGLKLKEL